MKAEVSQQRSLLDLAEVDAELRRVDHRAANLAEQQEFERVQALYQEANDQLAVVRIALEDVDGEVTKLESEIDSVRQREDRDRTLLQGGTVNAKQLSELQHELETLERRQSSLEDSLLEVMERREELQRQQSDHLARIDALQNELSAAQLARDAALVDIENVRQVSAGRRTELTSLLNADLVALYEKQRAGGGAGAGLLQGKRCGACRIEIDRGEMARIQAADDDEVLRCPECGAILLRVKQ
ncbi:zinc ribbon domain-containing protein [Mycolicibacterium frederiksbergense]|uniref:zinc ribbon domain-containing protein n=1 Tax=Mycolicibacterium frederiksbergense TaxID=117567 RepID=UPI00265BCD01|nr:C4-type zinc ribbon domain-containing protein [Mycolicibacterium frederiksbergense]MDO0976104.1 C4-type zinc ribbon domain-containing protein [Mycolicibacterium frederiksbergense]